MSLLRTALVNIKAVGYAAGYTIRRYPIGAGVIALVVFSMIWDRTHAVPPATETTEQIQARIEHEQRAATAQREKQAAKARQETARATRDRSLCRLKSTCQRYASVRQECATAGNFATCIDVKLGDDASLISACRNDGGLVYPPSDLPDAVSCWVRKVEDFIGAQ